jgi:hypothetical protein
MYKEDYSNKKIEQIIHFCKFGKNSVLIGFEFFLGQKYCIFSPCKKKFPSTVYEETSMFSVIYVEIVHAFHMYEFKLDPSFFFDSVSRLSSFLP